MGLEDVATWCKVEGLHFCMPGEPRPFGLRSQNNLAALRRESLISIFRSFLDEASKLDYWGRRLPGIAFV